MLKSVAPLIIIVLAGCGTNDRVIDRYFDARDRIGERLKPSNIDECERLYAMELGRIQAELEFYKLAKP
jgi:hypothetical protein